MIEAAEESLYENDVASWIEDEVFQRTDDAVRDLDEKLRAAFRAWLDAHPPTPHWEGGHDVVRHERTS